MPAAVMIVSLLCLVLHQSPTATAFNLATGRNNRGLRTTSSFQSHNNHGNNCFKSIKSKAKDTILICHAGEESNNDITNNNDNDDDDGNDTDTPSLATTAISSNPFLNLVSKGLRKTSLAMNKSTSDTIFTSTTSLQRMRQQIQQLTHIAPSSLGDHAGLGLFASKNIKAGTVVGLYPAHALGYELVVPIDGGSGMDDDDENDNDQDGTTAEEKEPEYQDLSMFLADNQEDELYFQQHPHGNSPYLHATDQPLFQRPSLLSSLFNDEIQNTPPLYLDVNPNRNDELDVAWTSHYINDGASLLDFCKQSQTLSQTQSEPPVTEEHIEQYYQQSTNTKNCIHIPFGPSPLLATVTTKKVKKGQELFTSYGVVYWLGAIDTSEEEDEASSAAITMPGMTEKIQSQILESARDLQKAMEGSKEAYGTEISNLEAVFGAL